MFAIDVTIVYVSTQHIYMSAHGSRMLPTQLQLEPIISYLVVGHTKKVRKIHMRYSQMKRFLRYINELGQGNDSRKSQMTMA